MTKTCEHPRLADLGIQRPPMLQAGQLVTDFDSDLQAWLDLHAAYWKCDECVALPKISVDAMRTVAHWRRGPNVFDFVMPPGTPIASFMRRDGCPSDLWDGGEGLGITGNNTTHSAVLAGYLTDAKDALIGIKVWELFPGCGQVRRRIYPRNNALFGTANAAAYFAIYEAPDRPLGGRDNPLFTAARPG